MCWQLTETGLTAMREAYPLWKRAEEDVAESLAQRTT